MFRVFMIQSNPCKTCHISDLYTSLNMNSQPKLSLVARQLNERMRKTLHYGNQQYDLTNAVR
jgi:IS30 family transposase